MLKEITKVKQIQGEPSRRWFASEDMEIIVWNSDNVAPDGFQLCYRQGKEEKALTWISGRGFSHERIDNGEGNPTRRKMTPILIPDGSFEKGRIIEILKEESVAMDASIAEFVFKTIEKYPAG